MDFFIPYFESYGAILGLTAVLLIIRKEAQRRFGNSHFIAEATLIYAAYFCYYLVRGMVKDQVSTARVNAHRVVDLERDLRIFFEPRIQELALGHSWLINAMNWIYVWFHWPVIVIVLVWLYFNHPGDYPIFRNGILISGALALLIFAFFPVAPPRFMPEFGFIDTIEQRSYSQHVLLPSGLANKYAAVPSLHAGWNLLMAVAIYKLGRNALFKFVGIMMPVLMSMSIVLTGNHYILDFVIGDLLAVAGLYLATRFFHETSREEPPPQSRPPELAMPST